MTANLPSEPAAAKRPSASSAGFVRSSDGTELHFDRQGVGRSVLLCDGLLCDGHIWKYVAPALCGECDLLHWHYPGHGESQDPPEQADVGPKRLADDAALVARSAGFDRVTVLGHSLGVQVALELWRRHRGIVDGLVLICGSPGNIVRDFHENAVLKWLVPVVDVAGRFLPSAVTALWRRIPSDPLLWLAMHSREVNTRLIKTADLAQYFGRLGRVEIRLALRFLEAAGHHDATPFLRDIDVPVLVVAAEQDRFTPAQRSRFMASAIPGAELLMVPQGTHSLPIEQPEIVNLRIRRFLRERLDPPAAAATNPRPRPSE
ncbi:MAG: alpha/beta hydrolase [Deltaproteobacteria bacterium]|nr:alpha/beta hydrolase [Deltaproteobacteria bacterium]